MTAMDGRLGGRLDGRSGPSNFTADNPFSGFWMGGYEGADHVNGFGVALDMALGNGHVAQLDADHRRAAELGIGCIRETIGWRLAETAPGRFDLSRARRVAASARRHGLQVLWTLMHYGTPADVSLLDDSSIPRFAAFATAVADTLGSMSDAPPVYNLVNEISFLAWAVSQTNMMHPYRNDPRFGAAGTEASGYEVKRRLVRMALAGIDAVRRIDPRARFLHIEPLVHVAPPRDRPELAELAERIGAYQWQAWDMLAGRSEPSLGGDMGGDMGGDIGGHSGALDLLGINHYHSSQWEAATEDRLWWHLRDARRRPFGDLLEAAWARYRRPMIVAETSHFGEGRPQWLNEMASEVERARLAQVPVLGICLYPLVDRPDWSNPAQWHHSGLWDVDAREVDAQEVDGQTAAPQRRILCADYAAALRGWQTRLPEPGSRRADKPVLLVFSHLRWGFVHHRPQQLLSRLSRRFHVFFVEEPLPLKADEQAPRLDCISHGPDIDVLLLRTSLADPSFSDLQSATLAPLLSAFLAGRGIADCIAWFYTPMAQPLLACLAGSLTPRRVVYDCIDEMSAFANSPPGLPVREQALLEAADLVLTSGPALQQAKAGGYRSVHCVPNGVDADHFSPASLDFGGAQALEARQRQGPLSGPRLGYCGVIDERIDIDLIETLALAHPDWQFVMAGPVIKVDTARLPRLANLCWLGHQPYVRLPYLLASWDVCLMPFAINAITRFINPTKALEYMAAEKPIVSTPVPDVIDLYGAEVRIAPAGAAFLAACEQVLQESPRTRDERVAMMRERVRRSGWDDRAESVLALLQDPQTEPTNNAETRRGLFLPPLPAPPTDAGLA